MRTPSPATDRPPAAPPPAPGTADLARRVADHCREHVLARWFPRCVDRERGGFHQAMARDWTVHPGPARSLVYQSRMTWVAAAAALWDPAERDAWAERAAHGLAGLHDHLADREHGAFWFAVDAPGQPRGRTEVKHAYGLSFVIYAAAAAYRAGVGDAAFDTAVETFRWLDVHAKDHRHGGYHEALARSGEPVGVAPPGFDGRRPGDLINTPRGDKSMNTHIHLLESFTALYRIWPDPTLRARLEELHGLVLKRMWAEPGCLHPFFTPDWRPVPACDSFGHDVETAYLLAEAAEALGRSDDEATWRAARSLVEHALAVGWDAEHGGFFDAGDAAGPVRDTRKVWWVQAEGLSALALMHHRFGRETDRYRRRLDAQWDFIEKHQADADHGGWYGYVSADGQAVLDDEKANEWKTAYHDGRALMNVSRLLGAGPGPNPAGPRQDRPPRQESQGVRP